MFILAVHFIWSNRGGKAPTNPCLIIPSYKFPIMGSSYFHRMYSYSYELI